LRIFAASAFFRAINYFPLKKLILATRKSPLALAQTEMAAAHLGARLGVETDLLKIVTTGDRRAEWSLEEHGGKGLFTKELERALLSGDADVAVHSAKDLPGDMPEDLAIAGYLPRADPRDVLVLRAGVATPKTIATGSPRRRLQIAMLFPGTQFTTIRGNVDTRLRKIAEGRTGEDGRESSKMRECGNVRVRKDGREDGKVRVREDGRESDKMREGDGENGAISADATLLAAAGLARLRIGNWPGVGFHALSFENMVPAVGQAAIAIQCRAADVARYAPHLDAETARAVTLERAFQTALGGGCHTALGVHASHDTLWFFHDQTGLRNLPLAPEDFTTPTETARRTLGYFGVQP
jgi:hydroxymethylbilane synthase